MNLTKAQISELALLLEGGADTPEELAKDFAGALDRMRGERMYWFAVFMVAGCPGVVGPFSTRLQATKAATKQLADKAWAVLGWTPEGQDKNLAEVYEKRNLVQTDWTPAKEFWQKVQAIKEKEATAITGNVTIRPLRGLS